MVCAKVLEEGRIAWQPRWWLGLFLTVQGRSSLLCLSERHKQGPATARNSLRIWHFRSFSTLPRNCPAGWRQKVASWSSERKESDASDESSSTGISTWSKSQAVIKGNLGECQWGEWNSAQSAGRSQNGGNTSHQTHSIAIVLKLQKHNWLLVKL